MAIDHVTRARRVRTSAPIPGGEPASPRVPLERRAVWALGLPTVAVFLAAALMQVAITVSGPHPWLLATFGLDGEHNVPAFWNSVLLLAIAAAALLLSVLTPTGRTPSAGLWRLAAVAATYLSMDEALSLHEKLGRPVNWLSERWGVDVPTYTWVIPGAVIVMAAGVLGVRVVASLPRDVRLGLVAGVATYVSGALVVETVNGALFAAGRHSLYALSTGVEELLEMTGCLVVACVLLRLVDLHPVTRVMTLRAAASPRVESDDSADLTTSD
ncbi:hypothetical protein [Cellulomonas aerilata]|uniref:Uncharacterized protein n=1 Tax=Cellulomonas aerilata TaxID=515326 RepID=A0A512DDY3_9CELL|nr:hypothetical protein [Cellulomonas aerilata]GEO34657.1 hypothetical protein CAE01nite_23820 [Cellulomonas aerilata]